MNTPRKILVVRTDRLGDVILSTPVIQNLREAFPTAHLAFMCQPYTRGALEGNPFLDEVIIYDKHKNHKSFLSTINFSRTLAARRFDWALILHPTNRAHLVTFLAGIPVRIGWNRKMGFLLTKPIPHVKQEGQKHELEYTLDLLRASGIPIVTSRTYFPVLPQARQKAKELLEAQGVRDEDLLIVLHPSASCPSKRWPQDRFCRLISLLREKISCKVAVVTAACEVVHGNKLVEINQVIDLRGKLDVPELDRAEQVRKAHRG